MKSSDLKTDSPQPSSTSKLRWKIISSALRGQVVNRNQASIRRFSSFGLFDRSEVETDDQTTDEATNQLEQRNNLIESIDQREQSVDQSNADRKSNQLDCSKEPGQLKDDKWFYYSLNHKNIEFRIRLRFTSNKLPIKELFRGFDNTGNYLWLSEEILSYFCLKNSFLFDKLNVCELGCGLSGFAGLTVAISSKANFVLLTDGNSRCMENVISIKKANQNLFDQTVVECKQLKWSLMHGNESNSEKSKHHRDCNQANDKPSKDKSKDKSIDENSSNKLIVDSLQSKFDVILCSDCLYFEKSHLLLIETIYSLLNDSGIAIIMAPLRKNSFKDFMKLSGRYFHLKIHIVYDDVVWKLNGKFQKELTDIYKTDLHYPLMAILQKRQTIL